MLGNYTFSTCYVCGVMHAMSASRTTIKYYKQPSGQNLADSVGNPRGLWLLVEGIHGEIWVVSETRIHVEIQGKFYKSKLKWEGSFTKPVNILIYQRMTSNHHRASHDWDPSYIILNDIGRDIGMIYILNDIGMISFWTILLHFEIFEGSMREISTRKYP